MCTAETRRDQSSAPTAGGGSWPSTSPSATGSCLACALPASSPACLAISRRASITASGSSSMPTAALKCFLADSASSCASFFFLSRMLALPTLRLTMELLAFCQTSFQTIQRSSSTKPAEKPSSLAFGPMG